MKFDSSFNLLWVKGSSQSSTGGIILNTLDVNRNGLNISTDTFGNVYAFGSYGLSVSFGTITLNTVGNDIDAFIVKYDSSGNVLWAKSVGGAENDYGNDITSDASGKIYITGNYSSNTFILGEDTLNNTGGIDIFIAKYDTSGNPIWAMGINGGIYYNQSNTISTDVYGNLYIAGYFGSSSLTFGSDSIVNSGGSTSMFIAKLDVIGTGIEEQNLNNNSTLYPNPTSDILNIKSTNLNANSNLEITNAYGQVIMSEKITVGNAKVNIQHLSSGIYFAKITNANGVVEINKVVKR